MDKAEVDGEEWVRQGPLGGGHEEREDTLAAGDEGGRPRPQDIRAASKEEASSTGSVTRAIGDGAYDSREIFRHLDTN